MSELTHDEEYEAQEKTEQIKVTTDLRGNVQINLEAWNVWALLSEDERYDVITSNAYWDIIRDALKRELKSGVSSKNFNSSCHMIRKMVCEDPELVSGLVVELVASLVTEIAHAKQEVRQADTALLEMRRYLEGHKEVCEFYPYKSRYDVGERYDFARVSGKEVAEDMRKLLGDLMEDLRAKGE